MNYQKVILVGNVTRDAQRHTSKKGDVSYTTFRVAVGDSKDRTIFFPVTVFGKHGESLVEYITKGRQLLVEGRIEASNNGRFNIVADTVRLGNSSNAGSAKPEEKSTETN